MAGKPEVEFNDEYSAPRRMLPGQVGRWSGYGIVAIILATMLYFAGGMLIINRVADDTTFTPPKPVEGGSHAVAMTAALIERETSIHRWVANDPWFLPGAALDNMPNFQQGIIYALSRFTVEMADQLGRTRGSSEVDADLDKAAGLLKYPGTIWLFDFSTSLAPTASSETQYRAAQRALERYNTRLAAGQAVFDRRADNLQPTLHRFTAHLGSSSTVIHQHLHKAGDWGIDREVDDIFYRIKGRTYGYYMVLSQLGLDFADVMRGKDVVKAWENMLESLKEAAVLDPLIVTNGSPDGLFLPSHLAVQGFYLLRARTQLNEIMAILQA